MTYYNAFLAAVPTDAQDRYRDFVAGEWPRFRRHGAIRQCDAWGADLPPGEHTDFQRAVQARADETVAFGWIEWPDRATADAAWAAIMGSDDPSPALPFDGQRMIWGGFAPEVADGTDRGGRYVQGYVIPVPAANRARFAPLARQVWTEQFCPLGALGNHENWGVDVPRGKITDFHRAVDAQEGEEIVVSWTTWPDRATCDAAVAQMRAAMEHTPPPDMPFDGKRMIWGGFSVIFDSENCR